MAIAELAAKKHVSDWLPVWRETACVCAGEHLSYLAAIPPLKVFLYYLFHGEGRI